MRTRKVLARLSWLLVLLIAGSTHAGFASADEVNLERLREIEKKIQEVARKQMGIVVAVTDGIGYGSGVIVSEDGLVLTAGHVFLTNGQNFRVIFPDGREIKAEPLGRNLNHDAGMLKISEPGPWPHAELGDIKALSKGDWCVCLGHSGGYELGRRPPVRAGRIVKFESDQVVTDCVLIGGDSGGPLFDLEGRVIAIHSSIGGSVAENRHVTIDVYQNDWDRLVSGEKWGQLPELAMKHQQQPRPSMGIRVDRSETVARILIVHNGKPAEKAGIQTGDIVLRFNSIPVNDSQHLIDLISNQSPGDAVKLVIRRGSEDLEISVTLGSSR